MQAIRALEFDRVVDVLADLSTPTSSVASSAPQESSSSMEAQTEVPVESAAQDQDAVLTDLEKNAATGFRPNSAAFFNMVRNHTIQGTFGDPYYGGNANFVGWDMIGYPGLRMAVSEDDQRMTKPSAVRESAYERNSMFSSRSGGGGHGH